MGSLTPVIEDVTEFAYLSAFEVKNEPNASPIMMPGNWEVAREAVKG
jgi:hypothetical protein